MPSQKLTIDCRMLENSGIGRYIKEIVIRLNKIYDITCLSASKDKAFFLGHQINFEIFDAPVFSLKEQFLFKKFIQRDSIFWSPQYNVPLFDSQKAKKITTIHDLYQLDCKAEISCLKFEYANKLIRKSIKQSDLIFTVSEFSKQRILTYYPEAEKNVKVVYNGVDTQKFNVEVSDLQKMKIAEKYNLPSNFILFVGNVKPNKNLFSLIKAVELVSTKRGNVNLVIVGKTDGFVTKDQAVSSLIKKAAVSENVVFTGKVLDEELVGLYKMADFFCFPSYYEGFGFPILEAMAAGCPVLCSNVASLPEISNSAAITFNPYEPQDIANAIESFYENTNLKADLIERGKSISKKFNWDEAVIGIIQNIESIK